MESLAIPEAAASPAIHHAITLATIRIATSVPRLRVILDQSSPDQS
jgi:hypothetical protein